MKAKVHGPKVIVHLENNQEFQEYVKFQDLCLKIIVLFLRCQLTRLWSEKISRMINKYSIKKI
jgi:hypothetical protein